MRSRMRAVARSSRAETSNLTRTVLTPVTTLIVSLALVAGFGVVASAAHADTRPTPGTSMTSTQKTQRPPARPRHYRAWLRIAHCESTSRWHINTGNGYYGGLQISPGTWRAFGGLRYARLPHHTTKIKQMRVAEKILRGQGWGAWPHCSRVAGMR